MTLANLASEMGAKNAVFPPDETLAQFYGKDKISGIWADDDAVYSKEIEIILAETSLIHIPESPDTLDRFSG